MTDSKKNGSSSPAVSPASRGSVVMDLDEVHPPGKVIELAANCVRFILAKYKVELDFTPDTLSLVDHYVDEAREAIAERPELLAVTAHAIGAYLGEVVRRSHACWWRIDHEDPGAWRLEFRTVYLSFYPVQVAYAALTREEDEASFSGFEMEDEDREALITRLADLPGVSEEAFFAPSTKLEVLDIAVDALLAKRAREPDAVRPYAPEDYDPPHQDD
ncbi:MAG: hypothetical protein R3B72_00780 [Polyangiaceae bacterium]